ncbi:MAG: amidohydrolase family protein [bacterium]
MAITQKFPTAFRDYREIHRLPYFEQDGDGEPALSPSLKKNLRIIDMHTHLAYTFFYSKPIQLLMKSHPVQFITPPGRSVYLDRYFYSGFSYQDTIRFYRSFIRFPFKSPQENRYHTIPNLIEDMDRFSIRYSIILPIELPGSRNSEHILKSCRGNRRLIPFCSIHPFTDHKRSRLKTYLRWGARGLKFHPVFQCYPPNGIEAMRLFEICAEERLPILSHTSSTGIELDIMKKFSRLKNFREPLSSFPQIPFVLGHAGFHEVDAAIELCHEFPNAYLEISGQPLSNIEKIIREAPADRIVFGSDWSWYNPSLPLACVLIATEGNEELRQKILYDNAARILAED